MQDNEVTVEMMREQLKFFGYRVVITRNRVETVASTTAELTDLIVMEIQMPVMDGCQAAAQIRQEPKTQSIPSLAATAKAMSRDKQTCLDSSCNNYIAKPFIHRRMQIAGEKLLTKPPEPR